MLHTPNHIIADTARTLIWRPQRSSARCILFFANRSRHLVPYPYCVYPPHLIIVVSGILRVFVLFEVAALTLWLKRCSGITRFLGASTFRHSTHTVVENLGRILNIYTFAATTPRGRTNTWEMSHMLGLPVYIEHFAILSFCCVGAVAVGAIE